MYQGHPGSRSLFQSVSLSLSLDTMTETDCGGIELATHRLSQCTETCMQNANWRPLGQSWNHFPRRWKSDQDKILWNLQIK